MHTQAMKECQLAMEVAHCCELLRNCSAEPSMDVGKPSPKALGSKSHSAVSLAGLPGLRAPCGAGCCRSAARTEAAPTGIGTGAICARSAGICVGALCVRSGGRQRRGIDSGSMLAAELMLPGEGSGSSSPPRAATKTPSSSMRVIEPTLLSLGLLLERRTRAPPAVAALLAAAAVASRLLRALAG